MNIQKTIIFIILTLSVLMLTAQTPDKNPEDWELVFVDEFNQDLDPDIWRIKHHFDHGGEPQMYTHREKNVRIENGLLILECHQEDYIDHQYTSGWVDLRKDYKYGFFEIRSRQDLGKGLWPAFWFSYASTTSDGWPPEIDIFETKGSDDSFFSGGIHARINGEPTKTYELIDYQQSVSQWHRYAIEWSPDIINWYVDDQLIGSTTIDVPQVLRRLVLNLAIYPWRQPDADADYFPAKFEMDYIKIWKRTGGAPHLSWKETWLSDQPNSIADWHLEPNDVFVAGDFNGDHKDEIFVVHPSSKQAMMIGYNDKEWKQKYTNGNTKKIGNWKIRKKDQYQVGDLDNDGQDELMLIHMASEKVQVISLKDDQWEILLELSKNDFASWELNKKDQFFMGNFHGDDAEELLVLNAVDNRCMLFSYEEKQNQILPIFGSDKLIDWDFGLEDQYIFGDFDQNGLEEWFLINSITKKAARYSFHEASWRLDYSNNKSGHIDNWILHKDDIYMAGDFDRNGIEDMLFINNNTHHSKIYQPLNWTVHWSNNGNPNIYNWHLFLEHGDQIICGNFEDYRPEQIFIVRHSERENESLSDYRNSIKASHKEFLRYRKKKRSFSMKAQKNVKTSQLLSAY